MTGDMNCEINDEPPKVGNIIINRIIVPNLVKKLSTSQAYFAGNKPTNIFPPSNG